MAYNEREGIEEGENGTNKYERAGVTHLCTWFAQGHAQNTVFVPRSCLF